MKKIVIIAILFLFSCKKEEQKPPISTETKKEIAVKDSVKTEKAKPILSQKEIALGEDLEEFNAYVTDVYTQNGLIYIDLDLVEIRYPTEGEWDVSDREIVNNNPKIRTYIVDDNTSVLTYVCQDVKPITFQYLLEVKNSVSKNKNIITIGKTKNGRVVNINFGCYG